MFWFVCYSRLLRYIWVAGLPFYVHVGWVSRCLVLFSGIVMFWFVCYSRLLRYIWVAGLPFYVYTCIHVYSFTFFASVLYIICTCNSMYCTCIRNMHIVSNVCVCMFNVET